MSDQTTGLVERLEKLNAERTRGPWRVRVNQQDAKHYIEYDDWMPNLTLGAVWSGGKSETTPDAVFITEFANQADAILTALRSYETQAEEIAGLREALSWKPMSTAPRDGTPVDLLHRDGGRLTEEFWVSDDEEWNCGIEDAHFVGWMIPPHHRTALSHGEKTDG